MGMNLLLRYAVNVFNFVFCWLAGKVCRIYSKPCNNIQN